MLLDANARILGPLNTGEFKLFVSLCDSKMSKLIMKLLFLEIAVASHLDVNHEPLIRRCGWSPVYPDE